MSDKVITTYKKLGQTPLECLEEVRVSRPYLADLPLTYAGRLDPMAEGLMIVLAGEECKNKDQYLGLDKTYEFEVLVGFATDTYDLLGVVISESASSKEEFERSSDLLSGLRSAGQTIPNPSFDSALKSFVGTFNQKYPSFSSKTVDGKQLFQLALDDELPDSLPEHEVTIHSLHCTSIVVQGTGSLEKEIIKRIELVHGDFRQEEIKKRWAEVFQGSNQEEYTIIRCVMECSSGTYVRQLVNDIGEKVGVPMVTYSIKRTRVGEYTLDDNINI
jgi:tRNA pseudouridine55 synthase